MAGELEKALASRMGNSESNDSLLKAMSALLILLIQQLDNKSEDDTLAKDIKGRIANKYPHPNNAGNLMMPSPS